MKKTILTITVILATALAQAAPLDFAKADANKDGSLTKEEWTAAQKTANPKMKEQAVANNFKRLDKDKNGNVSKEEFNKAKAAQQKKAADAKKGQDTEAKTKKKKEN